MGKGLCAPTLLSLSALLIQRGRFAFSFPLLLLVPGQRGVSGGVGVGNEGRRIFGHAGNQSHRQGKEKRKLGESKASEVRNYCLHK
jgi:hypothetical protein